MGDRASLQIGTFETGSSWLPTRPLTTPPPPPRLTAAHAHDAERPTRRPPARGRNCVERLLRRLRHLRRIHARYDELDTIYLSFTYLALVDDVLKKA